MQAAAGTAGTKRHVAFSRRAAAAEASGGHDAEVLKRLVGPASWEQKRPSTEGLRMSHASSK
jgi:hypothetical protein